MVTTRNRILQLLQRHKGATIDELAQELGLASASVRRHLDVLQREAEITYQEVRRPTGRPHFRYQLTEHGRGHLPQNYQALASWLLREMASFQPHELEGKNGQEMLSLALARAAREVAATYSHRLNQTTLRERVAALSHLLTENGFMSEWEEDKKGFRLMSYHCPYYMVAISARQVCTLDESFIGGLLKAPVTRTECLLDGRKCCLYLIEKEAKT